MKCSHSISLHQLTVHSYMVYTYSFSQHCVYSLQNLHRFTSLISALLLNDMIFFPQECMSRVILLHHRGGKRKTKHILSSHPSQMPSKHQCHLSACSFELRSQPHQHLVNWVNIHSPLSMREKSLSNWGVPTWRQEVRDDWWCNPVQWYNSSISFNSVHRTIIPSIGYTKSRF